MTFTPVNTGNRPRRDEGEEEDATGVPLPYPLTETTPDTIIEL